MFKLLSNFTALFRKTQFPPHPFVKLDGDELKILLCYDAQHVTNTFHLRHFATCNGLVEKGLLIMDEDLVTTMTLSLTKEGGDWLRNYRGKEYDSYIANKS